MNSAVLPDFFPLIDKKKKCKAVATDFFSCFSEQGKSTSKVFVLDYRVNRVATGKQEPGVRDPTAGVKGLEACKASLAKYSKCMVKNKADQDLKLVRAPEAYLEELKA